MQRSERAWSLEEPDEEGVKGPSRATTWHTHAANEHKGAERQGSPMLSMLSAEQTSRDCSRPSTGSAWAGQDISRQGSLSAPSVADLLGVLSQGGHMPSIGDPEHARHGSRPSSTASQDAGLSAQGASDYHSSAGQLSAGADVLGMPGSGHSLDEVHLPAGVPVTGVAGTAIQPETESAANGVQPLSRDSDKGIHELLIHGANQLPYDKADVSGWAGDQERLSENILPVEDLVGAHGQQDIDGLTGNGPALENLSPLEGPASSSHAPSLLQARPSAPPQPAAAVLQISRSSSMSRAPGQGPSVAMPASSGAASAGTKQPQAGLPSAAQDEDPLQGQGEEPPQASSTGPSAAPFHRMQRAAHMLHGLSTRAMQLSAQQASAPGGLSASDCVFPGSLEGIPSLSGAGQRIPEVPTLQTQPELGGSATASVPAESQDTAACSSEAHAISAAAKAQGTAAPGAPIGGDELVESHNSEGSATSAASEVRHAAKGGASAIRDELAVNYRLDAQAISAAVSGLGGATAEGTSAGTHKLVPNRACEEVAASHRVESQVSAVLSSVASFLGSAGGGSQASSPSSCPAMRHLSELESQLRSSQGSALGVCSDAVALDVPPPQHWYRQRDSHLRSSQGSAQGHDSDGADLEMLAHASHGDQPTHKAGAGDSTAASAIEHEEQSVLSGTGMHGAAAGPSWHELATHSADDEPARTFWCEAAVHGVDIQPAESAWHEAAMHGAAAGAGRQNVGPVSVLHDQSASAAAAASSTASAALHVHSPQQQSLSRHAGELQNATKTTI